MIDSMINWSVAYLEVGVAFVTSYLLTVEGMAVIMLSTFFLELVDNLRRR